MYIRRKVFSLLQDESGEERYFSTNEITLEDAEERVFSINEEDEREFSDKKDDDSKLKKAGKIAMGVGGAGTLAAGIGENIVGDKIIKKVADKHGVEKIGKGLGSGYFGLKDNVSKAQKVAERSIKGSKTMKGLRRADRIGAGVALAGLGAYTAGKILSRKKKDKE